MFSTSDSHTRALNLSSLTLQSDLVLVNNLLWNQQTYITYTLSKEPTDQVVLSMAVKVSRKSDAANVGNVEQI